MLFNRKVIIYRVGSFVLGSVMNLELECEWEKDYGKNNF